jgi:predicted RNA-binding Zn-ribbon protein involved in translation (DUF1610 family)
MSIQNCPYCGKHNFASSESEEKYSEYCSACKTKKVVIKAELINSFRCPVCNCNNGKLQTS